MMERATAPHKRHKGTQPSPASFPIGELGEEAADDAPGTPHPSAPAMEEHWEPSEDDSSTSASSRRTSSSTSGPTGSSSSTSSSLRSSRLGRQPSATAGAAAAALQQLQQQQQQCAMTCPPAGTDALPDAPALSVATLTVAHAWAVAGSSSSNSSIAALAHQRPHQRLLSFPVHLHDADMLGDLPEEVSPAGSVGTASDDSDDSDDDLLPDPYAAASLQAGAGRRGWRPAAAAQGAANIVRQLLVPRALFEGASASPGWPAPGPSLLLATDQSRLRCWHAYDGALQTCLRAAAQLQQCFVAALGRCLARLGLPGCEAAVAYWLATCCLGLLLYHWQLGLHLLPVAAAGLALATFAVLPSSSNSSSWDDGGGGSGYGLAGSSSWLLPGSGGGGRCSLWPFKLAGAVGAGHCLLLGLVGLAWQQLGAGGNLHARLLAATPQVLLLAGLLLAGQVAVEVASRGARCYRELAFGSLVWRGWCVAAAAVLLPGPSAATLAAAVPVAQKLHMLLEGPVLVHHLGQGSGSTSSGISSANSSGLSTWLLCVHCLLQLLVVLFVPPAPLAAVPWLPLALRSGLVGAARVLLCGCLMQLLLRLATPAAAPAVVSVSPVAPAASHQDRQQHHHHSHHHHQQHQQQLLPAVATVPPMAAPAAATSHDNAGSSFRGRRRRRAQAAAAAAAAAAEEAQHHRDDDSCYDGRPGSAASHRPAAAMPLAAAAAGGPWDLQLLQQGPSPVPVVTDPAMHGDMQLASRLQGCCSHPVGHAAALALGSAAAGGGGHHAAAAAAVGAVVKQHAVYLLLLLLAAGGDAFITAILPGAGVAGAGAAGVVVDMRAAWHTCLQRLLVCVFVGELALAAWHEAWLVQHHHVVQHHHLVHQSLAAGWGVGGIMVGAAAAVGASGPLPHPPVRALAL